MSQDAVMLNSIKAPEGGNLRIEMERVEVKSGESPLLPEMRVGDWVQVTVSDTGAGIPPEALPHIFEPFFTTKERDLGTGLGLAQVYGIVKAHEGRINVETSSDEGTTFSIYLPAFTRQAVESSPLELSSLATGQRETILVVEDNAPIRLALVQSLNLLNYRVFAAADGQDALELLKRQDLNVSLVLSDVVMPRMGGIALLHALRERELSVPVVMLTGYSMEKEMKGLCEQGVREWLPKPPRLDQLAEVVARALEQ